jgi:hypothetical protein
MAPPGIICAGCHNKITGRQYLKCSLCLEMFDLICANVPECSFLNTMTQTHKAVWKCQACKCKEPKGDNSNTPVRQAAYTLGTEAGHPSESPRSSPDNVTLRKHMPEAYIDQSHSLSYAQDVVYLDHVKEVIREELERELRDGWTDSCNCF